MNLFNNVYGAMHVEICACLRLLARLHYIMGDYAEVGLQPPCAGSERLPVHRARVLLILGPLWEDPWPCLFCEPWGSSKASCALTGKRGAGASPHGGDGKGTFLAGSRH